jgi:transposase IS116/IS110/IS902 family protein
MGIVGGLDIHRRQITFDYLDERSGETRHGRIAPADRMLLRGWLQQLGAGAGTSVAFAVEGCTGWRFVVEELQRAGVEAHPAEPADTSVARGPKRRAKTDWADARLLRDLLADGRLPGCRALQADYGIGPITATALWTELGDSRRFSASRKAVRHTGLDITVHSLRRRAAARAPVPAGIAAAALGLVRGRPVRRPPRLSRPRLLPADRRPGRRTGRPVGGPQDGPPGAPHPARAR